MGYQESFKALSDKTRRDILQMLRDKDRTAGDIAARFDMTQATVSHHLSVLREAGLVCDRREGKNIIYELNTSVLDEVLVWLIDLKGDSQHEA